VGKCWKVLKYIQIIFLVFKNCIFLLKIKLKIIISYILNEYTYLI